MAYITHGGICGQCGEEYYYPNAHDFSVPDYQYVDDMKCANFCENCDVYVDWSYHEGGVSDCQHKSVCEFCHHEYGKLGEHTPKPEWNNDENNHWHECGVCGEQLEKGVHADTNNDEKCDACGYAMPKVDVPELTPDKEPDKEPDDKETDKVTDRNDETGEDDKDETETDAPAENGGCGGCGSSAALSVIATVGVVGTALVIKKKED